MISIKVNENNEVSIKLLINIFKHSQKFKASSIKGTRPQ